MKFSKNKRVELKDKALDTLQLHIKDMGELQDFREYADEAYMMEPIDIDGKSLKAEKGRSSVKMSDVADTVEWIMPTLMRIFYGGQKVCEIVPMGKDDDLKARLMEEKINFDFMRQNNGFMILHDFFKDCMLSKMSVVKYWWEDTVEKEKKSYADMSVEEFAALQADDKFEVSSFEETVETISDGFDTLEITTYDVEGYKLTRITRPVAQCLPPEEFIFDVSERELTKNSFVCHKKEVHKNYLKSKYGVKEKDLHLSDQAFDVYEDTLLQQRFDDLGGKNWFKDYEQTDHYYIYECYMPDYDENGEPIPLKVTIFGNEVIDVEENTYGKPPFCTLSAIRKPYRMVGLSLAELVMEIQKLKTALMRAVLDNVYYQNNGVQVVNPYRINMDDVIDHNHPGAKWRTLYDVDPRTVVSPIQTNPLPPQINNILEYVEGMKENRTGVTKYNQGLDSKSLNKTATGISQIMSASQQRMELIARIFAETGVKDLFQAFVDMNLKFLETATNVKINEEWLDIKPDMIDGRFDILIDVGVGTGSNEIKTNQLMQMLNVSVPGMQIGVVTPENVYNMISEVWELMGYKNTDKFCTQPQGAFKPEIVNQVFQRLAAEGINIDGLIQQAEASIQAGASQPQTGSQTPAGPPPGR